MKVVRNPEDIDVNLLEEGNASLRSGTRRANGSNPSRVIGNFHVYPLSRTPANLHTYVSLEKAPINYTGALLFWQADTGCNAFSKGVFLTLPAFKEMCYFTAWCQLVADTIRIHIYNFRSFLSSDHGITRMNYLPDIRNHPGPLLPV